MTSVKTDGPLTVSTVTIRRKPALTYQSPPQSAPSHPETSLSTPPSATAAPLPIESPASRPSQMPELSERGTLVHKSSRHHITTPLLPLYHPFGSLALSLPDLDPTVFGLPASVAVFDDPTHRSSNRQRRPAAKVRDADDPATSNPPSFISVTLAPESEVREKMSPRRRRGGGPGGRRRRREPEDGDATYPAKRPRNSRSAGVLGARTLSREDGSPTLSNAHSRASPSVDAGRGDRVEEKKRKRRSTRSRGAIVRRDSTTSEDTATSASLSVSATNAALPRAESSGEPVETEEHAAMDASTEDTALGVESKEADPDRIAAPEQEVN